MRSGGWSQRSASGLEPRPGGDGPRIFRGVASALRPSHQVASRPFTPASVRGNVGPSRKLDITRPVSSSACCPHGTRSEVSIQEEEGVVRVVSPRRSQDCGAPFHPTCLHVSTLMLRAFCVPSGAFPGSRSLGFLCCRVLAESAFPPHRPWFYHRVDNHVVGTLCAEGRVSGT